MDDAKTPMYVSVGSILIHVATSYGMMKLLSTVGVTPERPNGFGHVGVALATSTVALVNFLALSLLMRRRIDRLNGRSILTALLKIGLSSVIMSAVCLQAYWFLHARLGADGTAARLIECFVPIALGGVSFFIMAKLLKVTEIEKLVGAVKRKIARR